MSNLICAPDDFYDAKLVSAEVKDTEDYGPILELSFSVGADYFYAKQSIFLKAKDGEEDWAKEKRETALSLIKSNFPTAVVNGRISLPALVNPSKETTDAIVRIKVTNDGKFSKAQMVASKSKPKVSREDAIKGVKAFAVKNRALLASLGFTCDAPDAPKEDDGGGDRTAVPGEVVDDLPF